MVSGRSRPCPLFEPGKECKSRLRFMGLPVPVGGLVPAAGSPGAAGKKGIAWAIWGRIPGIHGQDSQVAGSPEISLREDFSATFAFRETIHEYSTNKRISDYYSFIRFPFVDGLRARSSCRPDRWTVGKRLGFWYWPGSQSSIVHGPSSVRFMAHSASG